MRVKYWMPYEAQPHITSDLGEASKLVQAKQATLESVEHEKPGKRIIVQMTYLNDIGGIETAMANMSAAFPEANFCFVINSHASNAEAQILRLAQRHDVLIDKSGNAHYNGDIALIFTPIMQSVPFERIHCPIVYQFIHSDIGKLMKMEQWHDFKWQPHPKVKKVISVSETAKESLKQALGVDSEVLANILAEPSKRPVFLCLSRATPEKGIDRLLKMVQAFDRAGKDYALYLCSTLDPYGQYYHELKNSSHVVLVEPNPYNDSLMRCADYLVQLSTCESYCYSVHQATAQGVAVIGTKIPEIEKVVTDGKNGYLLNLDMSNLDVEKIFNKIPRPKAKPEPIDPNWLKVLTGEL